MNEQSIEGLVRTSLESIKEMVDVNTVVGDAVNAPDGTVIIPISRVSFGFAAGGGSCDGETTAPMQGFGGGSGAGVSVKPVGFLVSSPEHGIRFMDVSNHRTYERFLDLLPLAIDKLEDVFARKQDVSSKSTLSPYGSSYSTHSDIDSD